MGPATGHSCGDQAATSSILPLRSALRARCRSSRQVAHLRLDSANRASPDSVAVVRAAVRRRPRDATRAGLASSGPSTESARQPLKLTFLRLTCPVKLGRRRVWPRRPVTLRRPPSPFPSTGQKSAARSATVAVRPSATASVLRSTVPLRETLLRPLERELQ